MRLPDTEAWQEALARVPGATTAEGYEVQVLSGGAANATYRVQTGKGRYVVRLHEPYVLDLGVDRRREAVLHAAAAAAGLASRIVAADPQGRYLVTQFLDGQPWQAADFEDATRLRALAGSLRALHSLPAPVVPPLDVAMLLQRHVTQVAAQDAAAVQDLLPQVARARDILARQGNAGRPACIIHGDLTHSNVIGAGEPQLIDWEYAAVTDPLTDLACLVAYYPQAMGHGAELLRHCGLAESASLPELEELAGIYRLLSNLWYRRLALARRHLRPAH
ncbi:MAG TPA: phosphotransferase [Steroidobacteraceae bacterium]|nr:phosphotransferase [Steroidobacteraceae bacterium]